MLTIVPLTRIVGAQLCGITIVQAIALLVASDEVALRAAAVPAGTFVASAVMAEMLPPPVPLVLVRRVTPEVVQVRAELALSDQ